MKSWVIFTLGAYLSVVVPIPTAAASMQLIPQSAIAPTKFDETRSALDDLKGRLYALADKFTPNVTRREEVEAILGVTFSVPDDLRDRTNNSAEYATGVSNLPFTVMIHKNLNDRASPVRGIDGWFTTVPIADELDSCFSLHEAKADIAARGWHDEGAFIKGDSHGFQAEKNGVHIKFSAKGGIGPIPEIDNSGGPPGSPAYEDFEQRMQDGCIYNMSMNSYKS